MSRSLIVLSVLCALGCGEGVSREPEMHPRGQASEPRCEPRGCEGIQCGEVDLRR